MTSGWLRFVLCSVALTWAGTGECVAQEDAAPPMSTAPVREQKQEQCLRRITQLLSDPDPDYRSEATGLLWPAGVAAEVAVPLLERTTEDRELEVRHAALIALWDYGREARPALPRLLQLVEKERGEIRRLAIGVMGELTEDAEVVRPVLVRALDDDHDGVRAQAAHALEGFGPASPEVNARLIAMVLRDAVSAVRRCALDCLQKIGSVTETVNALEHAARTDPDPAVRTAADAALKRVRPGE